jgi:hypothetical protein
VLIGDRVIPPAFADKTASVMVWQMHALGLVNATVREINEMRCEFDEPFIVESYPTEPNSAWAPRPSPTRSNRPCGDTARRRLRPPPQITRARSASQHARRRGRSEATTKAAFRRRREATHRRRSASNQGPFTRRFGPRQKSNHGHL